MTDPYQQMHDAIVGTGSVFLAEHAGMFCDGIDACMKDHGIDFSGSEFVFEADEPYELYFEWYFGEVRAGVSIRADPDESEWFVYRTDGKRRSRFRKPVGRDPESAAAEFLTELEISLNDPAGFHN